jgi:hypothetical protein
VTALRNNILADQSDLIIYSDGPKNEKSLEKVLEVRKYLKTISGFKSISIIEKTENAGLSKSIISGVTETVNKYGKAIVMEDDLVTSKYFLQYMNEALDTYEHEDKVVSIHGYIYPVKNKIPETFFIRGADCWGWATWKRGWDIFESDGKKLLETLEQRKLTYDFDFDGNYHYTNMLKKQIAGLNDSWAVRWYASAFLKDRLTLYPGISLVENIGQDSSGTHGKGSDLYDTKVSEKKITIGNIPVEENIEARIAIIKYFKSLRPNIFKRIFNRLF